MNQVESTSTNCYHDWEIGFGEKKKKGLILASSNSPPPPFDIIYFDLIRPNHHTVVYIL